MLLNCVNGVKQVFLHATTSKKQTMQLKMRNIEWWMRRRNLPLGFRQRVRNYERQKWAAMRGVDECQMTKNLPEGLRRDIKYHLCLDLVRQVCPISILHSKKAEKRCFQKTMNPLSFSYHTFCFLPFVSNSLLLSGQKDLHWAVSNPTIEIDPIKLLKRQTLGASIELPPLSPHPAHL